MSGIPDQEIARAEGMVPLGRPVAFYEVRVRVGGDLQLTEWPKDWASATSYFLDLVSAIRLFKTHLWPDQPVLITMQAVTGPYPSSSWSVGNVTI